MESSRKFLRMRRVSLVSRSASQASSVRSANFIRRTVLERWASGEDNSLQASFQVVDSDGEDWNASVSLSKVLILRKDWQSNSNGCFIEFIEFHSVLHCRSRLRSSRIGWNSDRKVMTCCCQLVAECSCFTRLRDLLRDQETCSLTIANVRVGFGYYLCVFMTDVNTVFISIILKISL